MRRLSILAILFMLFAAGGTESVAQQRDLPFEYTLLVNWPPALRDAAAAGETHFAYDLLPVIDTLALGYAYVEENGQPVMHFSLDWTPGPFGIYDNKKVAYEDLPEDIRIIAVDLRAEVYVDDQPVAALMLALDSLALAPTPDQVVFEDERTWQTVFSGTPEDTARSYFANGFTLHDLRIDRIAFASYEPRVEEDAPYDPRYPTWVGVYPPDGIIWVDWVIGRRSGAGKRGGSVAEPRRKPREGIGRTIPSDTERPRRRTGDRREPDEDPEKDPTTRTRTGDRDKATAGRDTGRGKKRSGKTKDDDDDDEELLPAALAGAAAVGLLAVAGGTVGYYGNAEMPLGLTSGLVRPKGGVLVQMAVNTAVLGADDEPEKLLVKVMGFYGVANLPIQPALGLGVMAEENGDDLDLTPSLSLGAVGNFGRLILFGGYDFAADGVDFGFAFNFRGRPR